MQIVGVGLEAVSLSDNYTLWTFDGDGSGIGMPILVNGYVFAGSLAGHVYAIDAVTGQSGWSANFAGSVDIATSGDGVLVVTGGTTLAVYALH